MPASGVSIYSASARRTVEVGRGLIAITPTGGIMNVIAGILAEYGPMTEQQLSAALAERGIDSGSASGRALLDALDDRVGPVVRLADNRWAWLPALLTGRVFTHQLTSREIHHDVLDMVFDLNPLSALIGSEVYQRLVGGGSIHEVLVPFDNDILDERGIPPDMIGDHGGLLLPPGYLSAIGAAEGDVIGLRLTAAGLILEPRPEQEPPPEPVRRLNERLGTVLGSQPNTPMPLDVAIWTACAADLALLTEPLPPLSTVLDTCNLSRDGGWLAVTGFDYPRWHAATTREPDGARHVFSDDEITKLLAIIMRPEQ